MKVNPNNYDAWFDYLRLVESEGNLEVIREMYERAIANVPPTKVSELLSPLLYNYGTSQMCRHHTST